MVLLIIDEEIKDWKQISKEEKNTYDEDKQKKVLYIDGKLKSKLDFAIEQQSKNNDAVGIVVGDEGSGKSTLAGNCMRYVTKDTWDPKTQIIGSDYQQGLKVLRDVKKGGAVFFDEGNAFFMSTEVMKKEARDLHRVFSIFRQKNLFVLIVLPSFFRLSSYFAIDRSRFLMRTYLKGGERSFFEYYGNKRKDKLYRIGKSEHNYKVVRPSLRGRFDRCYPLESEEYIKFKEKTLNTAIQGAMEGKKISKAQIEKEFIRTIIKNNIDKSSTEIASIIPLSDRRIRSIKKELLSEAKEKEFVEKVK